MEEISAQSVEISNILNEGYTLIRDLPFFYQLIFVLGLIAPFVAPFFIVKWLKKRRKQVLLELEENERRAQAQSEAHARREAEEARIYARDASAPVHGLGQRIREDEERKRRKKEEFQRLLNERKYRDDAYHGLAGYLDWENSGKACYHLDDYGRCKYYEKGCDFKFINAANCSGFESVDGEPL